jgi:hypothetical protein
VSFPCPYCNVRPDIACRHRPADPSFIPADFRARSEPRIDLRILNAGGGRYRIPKHRLTNPAH